MPSDTLEALAGTELTVAGKAILIKRLSLRQLLAIMRLAADAYKNLNEHQRKILRDAAETARGTDDSPTSAAERNAAAAEALFEVLDETTIGKLLALVTGVEADWCLDNLGLPETARIIEELAAQQQLQEVAAAFRRVAKGWQPPSKN